MVYIHESNLYKIKKKIDKRNKKYRLNSLPRYSLQEAFFIHNLIML
jgi:hypothetical protein